MSNKRYQLMIAIAFFGMICPPSFAQNLYAPSATTPTSNAPLSATDFKNQVNTLSASAKQALRNQALNEIKAMSDYYKSTTPGATATSPASPPTTTTPPQNTVSTPTNSMGGTNNGNTSQGGSGYTGFTGSRTPPSTYGGGQPSSPPPSQGGSSGQTGSYGGSSSGGGGLGIRY